MEQTWQPRLEEGCRRVLHRAGGGAHRVVRRNEQPDAVRAGPGPLCRNLRFVSNLLHKAAGVFVAFIHKSARPEHELRVRRLRGAAEGRRRTCG